MRHPVVASHRQLQATAQTVARDRGDHRLARFFDRRHHRQQIRCQARFGRAELTYIGAAREGAVAAGEHDRPNGRVGLRRVNGGHDAHPQRQAQAVDRRVVHRHDGDGALAAGIDCGGHAGVSSSIGAKSATMAAKACG